MAATVLPALRYGKTVAEFGVMWLKTKIGEEHEQVWRRIRWDVLVGPWWMRECRIGSHVPQCRHRPAWRCAGLWLDPADDGIRHWSYIWLPPDRKSTRLNSSH